MTERNRSLRIYIVVGSIVLVAIFSKLADATHQNMNRPPTGMRDVEAKMDASNPQVIEQARIDALRDYQNRVREAGDLTFEEFEELTYREPGGGKYIVDGDMPISDRKHLEEFFETKIKRLHTINRRMGELIVSASGIQDSGWDNTQKHNLSYCISRGFGANYKIVVDAMEGAAGAWEAVADIKFVHDTLHDANCTANNDQVLFDLRPVSGAHYLARAFFPGEPRSSRNVLIDDLSFTLDPDDFLSLTGILRHQIGHILGFRHEHVRPNAGICFEDINWRPLTSYDMFSVMDYPQCNGGGDWPLQLNDSDKSSAACIYGAAPGFTIDSGICSVRVQAPIAPGIRESYFVTEEGSINLKQIIQIGNYNVVPGTVFRVEMIGTGDPDLYVRFDNQPSTSAYDCRPYLTGATELCNLTVPIGVSRGFVMLKGYRASTYLLKIVNTPHL